MCLIAKYCCCIVLTLLLTRESGSLKCIPRGADLIFVMRKYVLYCINIITDIWVDLIRYVN